MADFMAGMEMDPFLIFPEEVWDLILDQVEDSQDAWNLLKAFPQLDANTALQKKKHFWLFGLVIPHLIPWMKSCWIKEKDLLNCRQVCRKWSTAVDGFLESQPQLRAYHPETDGQVGQLIGACRFHWDVKAYLFDKDFEKFHFGGTRFEISDASQLADDNSDSDDDDDDNSTPGDPQPVQRFLRDMAAHPPGRSPFLSRALTIYFYGKEEDADLEDTDSAEDILGLHSKFGEHVWFYNVEFVWDSLGPISFAEGISFLPNLKLLHVVLAAIDSTPPPSDADLNKFMEQFEKNLPALPFLETLRFGKCPQKLSHLLISRFSAQIRILDLGIGLWRDEYAKLFPNLTELVLSDWHERCEGDKIKELLSSLDSPQLVKLQLRFPLSNKELPEPFPIVIEDDVFQWLKRFPNMKFLDIGYDCEYAHCIERGVLDPAHDSISSLQFLAIHTSFEINYNFLRCLPSLQHLRLYVSSKPFVMDLSTNPVVKILEEIQTASMYKSNVWELLPKLKTVVVVAAEKWWNIWTDETIDSYSYAFHRERYEFERRLNEGLLAVGSGADDVALAPLRKDIIDSLQENANLNRERVSREMDWEDELEEESDLDGDMILEAEDDVEDGEDLVDEEENEEIEN